MGRLLVRGGTGGQAMGARQLTPYVVLLIGLLLAACSAAAVEQPPEPVQVETPLPDQPVDSSPSSTPVWEPMEESVPLGAFTQGSFSVWLNGERVTEFEL